MILKNKDHKEKDIAYRSYVLFLSAAAGEKKEMLNFTAFKIKIHHVIFVREQNKTK